MGTQTMGSQQGSNGKQPQLQPLVRQNSMYSLTFDEVQNQLGDLGKPVSSMNLDELLKNISTVESSVPVGMKIEGAPQASQAAPPLQHQPNLPLTRELSKKTVDEVWRDIQQKKDNEEKKAQQERQSTLGEMTLEDFLVQAGIVAENTSDRKDTGTIANIESNVVVPQFPPQAPQGQWMQQYPPQQYQHPQQGFVGMYMPSQGIGQQVHMGAGSSSDGPFADCQAQVALPSPVVGTVSETRTPGRKRGNPEELMEKSVERRQKRMIKNRESAARSRARKQAYTNELENKVSRLEEENERLRKQQELERRLPVAPPEPKYQLRRTASAPF